MIAKRAGYFLGKVAAANPEELARLRQYWEEEAQTGAVPDSDFHLGPVQETILEILRNREPPYTGTEYLLPRNNARHIYINHMLEKDKEDPLRERRVQSQRLIDMAVKHLQEILDAESPEHIVSYRNGNTADVIFHRKPNNHASTLITRSSRAGGLAYDGNVNIQTAYNPKIQQLAKLTTKKDKQS